MSRGVLACAMIALIGLSACEQFGMREPQPGADSILEVFALPTPEEAAAMFDSADPDQRYRGAVLLTQAWFAGDPKYLRAFEDYLLNDPDPSIRAVCARGLGNHAGADYAPALARALREDPDQEVREEAARALQRIHNPVVIPALVQASREPPGNSEPEAAVRVEAVVALGQYADPFVVDSLIAALDDSSLVVHRAAITSLKTLTGQDFGYDPIAWQRWAQATDDLFAARGVYEYPVFSRSKLWWEYVPGVPPPPNEQPSTPSGISPEDL